jgi:polysaccharide biosynthesis protein PelF
VSANALERMAGGDRSRILLITEGTYPFAVGGVSSWCDLLLRELTDFAWQVLPIVAPTMRRPAYELPAHADLTDRIELWSEALPRPRWRARGGRGLHMDLPGVLVRELIGWKRDGGALLDSLLWCRRHPESIRRVFRSARGWAAFRDGLRDVLDEQVAEAARPPDLDALEGAMLYQTLYWIARTAGAPTPPTDLLHVTAAGWAGIPALVHKALHGTPMLLTEHGVYVREAYLGAARSSDSPGTRFISTRLALGLARAAYAAADVVSPVTDANACWEQGLGVDADRISVIYNGLRPPPPPAPPPGNRTVVSVGRIDPLKDVHCMLHVAARTLRSVPDARFLHFGPVTDGQEVYGDSCLALHQRLGLGDRFRFMGRTTDPHGVVREADVVIMTSISEGLPMSILEAMGQGRPVVATGVGGVGDVVKGCGVVRPPGDVHGLATAVATLLRNPGLAWMLGERGYRRLGRLFNEATCVEAYRDLLHGIIAGNEPSATIAAPLAA